MDGHAIVSPGKLEVAPRYDVQDVRWVAPLCRLCSRLDNSSSICRVAILTSNQLSRDSQCELGRASAMVVLHGHLNGANHFSTRLGTNNQAKSN